MDLTDVEIEAAKQLVHLSESETTTSSSAAAVSATSSSSSCGGPVAVNCAEKRNGSIGGNESNKRKIRRDKNKNLKIKTRKEFDHFDDDDDDDDDGEEVICSLMRSNFSKRYRSIVDIYKVTKPFN